MSLSIGEAAGVRHEYGQPRASPLIMTGLDGQSIAMPELEYSPAIGCGIGLPLV